MAISFRNSAIGNVDIKDVSVKSNEGIISEMRFASYKNSDGVVKDFWSTFPQENSLTILDGRDAPNGNAWKNCSQSGSQNGNLVNVWNYDSTNKCYQFRTPSGQRGVCTTAKPNQGVYTIHMYCSFPSFTTTYYPICISGNSYPEPTGGLILEVSQPSGFRLRFKGAGTATYITSAWSGTALVVGKKYHVAIVANGTNFSLYVNGELKASYSYPTYLINWATVTQTFFGSNSMNQEYPSNIDIYAAFLYLIDQSSLMQEIYKSLTYAFGA